MKLTALHISDVDIVAISPDGRTRFVLEWQDEIHFGPPFFALWVQLLQPHVDSFWGPGRNERYGGIVAFSPDGRIAFLERWNSIKRPDMDIIAIDLHNGNEAVALHLGSGFFRGIDRTSPTTDVGDPWTVHFDKFDGKDWQCQSQAVILPSADKWRHLDWFPTTTVP
jgi:hypothetical protein